jgi:ligand-binding sensor domain-containing protein
VYRLSASTAPDAGGEAFTNFTTADGLIDNDVSAIIEDGKGNIIFGTKRGLCKYDGRSFSPYSDNAELNGIPASRMLLDRQGNLWLGTLHAGAYRFNGTTLTNHLNTNARGTEPNGTSATIIYIFEDRAGNVWFCSWNRGGVCRYDGSTFTTYVPSDAYYATEDGRQGQGPLPTRYLPSRPEATIADDMIFSMTEDRAGNYWFATRRHGACRFDGTTFTSYREYEGFVSSGVYAVLEDRNGHFWFTAEEAGVWRYDGVTFKNFTTDDGLVNNSVMSMLEDRDGNLWFGTRQFGLSRFDGTGFTTYSE